MFSHNALIRDFEGERVLMLRIANERHNRIVEATASLSLVRDEVNEQGERFIRIHDLRLIRHRTPVFALTWTLIHPIDERSPLLGYNASELAANRSRITVSVNGHDETLAALVYANYNYVAEDIVFDAHFADIISMTPEGGSVINLTRFHDIELAPSNAGSVD
jgi:inward rectifier potassium channel